SWIKSCVSVCFVPVRGLRGSRLFSAFLALAFPLCLCGSSRRRVVYLFLLLGFVAGCGRTGGGPAVTLPPAVSAPAVTFTDVTEAAGLTARFYGMGLAVGDYDNDGWDDLFVSAVGRSRVFHNVPDGKGGRKFVEVTLSCGIDDRGWATSAAWVDYDRDG